MYLFKLIFCLLLYQGLQAQPIDLPRGFEQLPGRARQVLLQQKSQIRSLQASIRQKIKQGTFIENRTGFYWADSKGRFRAAYSSPVESVVFNGETLYWQIPSNGFTWVISAGNAKGGPTNVNPLQKKKSSWLTSDFRIKPLKNYNPFSDTVRYLVLPLAQKSPKPFGRLELHLDLGLKAITRRIMFDARGRQVLLEEFSRPLNYQGETFFQVVEISAKNHQSGVIVSSKTEYEAVVFNVDLKDIFYAPAGPYRKYPPEK